MNRQATIEKAFYSKIASLNLSYVSWPNGPSISPPATSINYSLDIDYGEGEHPEMYSNSFDRFVGTFSVTVRCPVTTDEGDAPGIRPVLAAAEAIAATFKRGSVHAYAVSRVETTYVRCSTPSVLHRGKVTPEWYSIVVRIPFMADVPNANFVTGLAPSSLLAPSSTLAPSSNHYV